MLGGRQPRKSQTPTPNGGGSSSNSARKGNNVTAVPSPVPLLLADEDLLPAWQSELLRITNALKTFDFSRLKRNLVNNRGFSEQDALALIRELCKLLTLKVLDSDWDADKLSPSYKVDQAWHALLEFPADYLALCALILPAASGRQVIDHNPLGAEDVGRAERFQNTLHRYKDIFGRDAPSELWAETNHNAPHAGSKRTRVDDGANGTPRSIGQLEAVGQQIQPFLDADRYRDAVSNLNAAQRIVDSFRNPVKVSVTVRVNKSPKLPSGELQIALYPAQGESYILEQIGTKLDGLYGKGRPNFAAGAKKLHSLESKQQSHSIDENNVLLITEGSKWAVQYGLHVDDIVPCYNLSDDGSLVSLGDIAHTEKQNTTMSRVRALRGAPKVVESLLHYSLDRGWHRICSVQASMEISILDQYKLGDHRIRVFPSTSCTFLFENLQCLGYTRDSIRLVWEGAYVQPGQLLKTLGVENGDTLDLYRAATGC